MQVKSKEFGFWFKSMQREHPFAWGKSKGQAAVRTKKKIKTESISILDSHTTANLHCPCHASKSSEEEKLPKKWDLVRAIDDNLNRPDVNGVTVVKPSEG